MPLASARLSKLADEGSIIGLGYTRNESSSYRLQFNHGNIHVSIHDTYWF